MAAVYDKSAKLFLTIMIFFLPEIKALKMANFEWRRNLKFTGAVFDPSVVVQFTITITQTPSVIMRMVST